MIELFLYGIPGYDEDSVLNLFRHSNGEPYQALGNSSLKITPLQPSALHTSLKSAITLNHKICILFVIKKGRITEEIENLPQSELKIIFSGALPVLLLITACDSALDESWWYDNCEYFRPYGIMNQFEEVIHGTVDSEPMYKKNWKTTQSKVFKSILQNAAMVDELELFSNESYSLAMELTKIVYFHLKSNRKLYFSVISVMLVFSLYNNFLKSFSKFTNTIADEPANQPSIEELYQMVQQNTLEITALKARLENCEEKLFSSGKMLASLTALYGQIKNVFLNEH